MAKTNHHLQAETGQLLSDVSQQVTCLKSTCLAFPTQWLHAALVAEHGSRFSGDVQRATVYTRRSNLA